MKKTKEQHNERKKEIMEKCFECYAENGLTGTGIKALAAACNCTTGNLYCYFKNIDELILESTAYCMTKVEDDFMESNNKTIRLRMLRMCYGLLKRCLTGQRRSTGKSIV